MEKCDYVMVKERIIVPDAVAVKEQIVVPEAVAVKETVSARQDISGPSVTALTKEITISVFPKPMWREKWTGATARAKIF